MQTMGDVLSIEETEEFVHEVWFLGGIFLLQLAQQTNNRLTLMVMAMSITRSLLACSSNMGSVVVQPHY